MLTTPNAKSPHSVLYYEYDGIRQGNWKLVKVKRSFQLFDLATDIGETTNLAANHPAKVAELQRLLDAHKRNVTSDRRPAGSAENPHPVLTQPGNLPTLAEYMNRSDLRAAGSIHK